MVEDVCSMYPNTKLMGVGFSMGGNIVVKYVSESKEREGKFLCVMSICQGYSANQYVAMILCKRLNILPDLINDQIYLYMYKYSENLVMSVRWFVVTFLAC